ncbi:MAG: ABC transporter ATP-binding protein [Firmicutes bacterium]|nr:ABC transporter ATP-binding protein [Bacillota bacterium]
MVGREDVRGAEVTVQSLSRIYPHPCRTVALQEITLTVRPGEWLAIVGPSGSGKTTLANILGLMDRPSSGRYWLDGRDVTALSDRERALVRNRLLGFVYQSFHLIPTLTARENVELPLVYRGVPRRRRRELAEAWLCRLGLEGRLHHRPFELSGGQQQRVALARALIGSPRLLLADEPTGNLDEENARDMRRLFSELRDQGQTIILITHDWALAQSADRIARLEAGRLVGDMAGRTGYAR